MKLKSFMPYACPQFESNQRRKFGKLIKQGIGHKEIVKRFPDEEVCEYKIVIAVKKSSLEEKCWRNNFSPLDIIRSMIVNYVDISGIQFGYCPRKGVDIFCHNSPFFEFFVFKRVRYAAYTRYYEEIVVCKKVYRKIKTNDLKYI